MLLATKLRGPTDAGQWVTRERLLADVASRHRGRHCRACVIAATGGFGKTTLAAQLGERLAHAGETVSWLSLDGDDDNAERLCEYVLAALHRAQPSVDLELASLLADRAPDSPVRVLTAAINAIAASGERINVILDDVHCITDPRACELLRFLVSRGPDNLHVIMTLRPPAPIPLAALRAHDELTEIDASELRFDAVESDALLNRLAQLQLDPGAIRTLCERTEGWPAALRLASISLRDRGDRAVETVIGGLSGATRAVSDYLSEHVLDQLDATWARFLVATSVLDRMCADLCDAVTGVTGSQELLERTERAGLFLVGLDGERRWFRYHHLFRDFLRRRLASTPELSAPQLHLAAATWFERHGTIEEAFGHALAAGDAERAKEIVERNAMLLVEQGRMAMLLELVANLPAAVCAHSGALQIAIAWARCLLQAPVDDGTPLVAFAPGEPALDAELDLIRAVRAGFETDDPARVEALLERALPQLPGEPWLQGVAANALAFAELRRGQLVAARDATLRGRPHQERARGSFTGVYGRCIEAIALTQLGELDVAARGLERALEIAAKDGGRHGYGARMTSAFLGEIRYEQNQLAAASELLDAAYSVRESGIPDIAIAIYIARSRLHEARGEHDAALAELYEGARQAGALRLDRLAAAVLHEEVRVHLAHGDIEGAARRGAVSPEAMPTAAPDRPAWQLRQLARARVSLAQGRPDRARQILAELTAPTERDGDQRRLLSIHALAAVAAHAAGDLQASRTELASALALGEASGAVRTLVDEGPALHALLRRIPSTVYLARVLAAARLVSVPLGVARPALIEALNVRELQILRLVEEGLTNKDISAALGIKLDTVKWHLKNAFGKLGVATRTAAIHSARAVGVLGASSAIRLARSAPS